MADPNALIKEWDLLKSQRFNWDSHWQRVHDIVWPDGGEFTRERSPGERRTSNPQLYDMTNVLAIESFAAVMESLLTPRNQIWHRLKPSLPELAEVHEAKEYFEELTRILFAVRNRPGSGFYDQKHEGYKSLGAYGNDCLNPAPMKGGGISYRYVHVGAVWVETDDRGRIDTIFYKFKLSRKAAFQKWGDRSPKCVMDKLEAKPYEDCEFLHVVKPRKDFDPRLIGPKGMKWESWEVSIKDREFIFIRDALRGTLEESGGFDTIPYIYSRFTVNPAEKHGRGPAMLILPDNESLQEMSRSQLLAGQMAAEPPLLTQDDGLLAQVDADEGLTLQPGALNSGWLDQFGKPRAVAFDNGYKHTLTEDMLAQKRDVINQAHLVTLFQILVDNPQMTATEALLRAQEKGQLITPTVGRQQDEMLGRMIERELDILEQQGLLPPPPQVLVEAEGEYDIVYESAATRLQKEEEIQAVRAAYADIIPLMELDPTVASVPKIHETARFLLEARGVPARLINSEEEVREELAAEAEVSQEEQAIDAIPGMARAAKDLQSANLLPQQTQQAAAG